jgi:hypothetical protein
MNEPQHQFTASDEVEHLNTQHQVDDPSTMKDQDFQPESGAVDGEQATRRLNGEARIEANDEALEEA